MNAWIRNFTLLALMLAASAGAVALRPTHKMAEHELTVDLQAIVPGRFGDWSEAPESSTQVVDPQQAEMLTRIYTQTISRSYVNGKGYRVMLSIAYGADQSDSVQLHYPEVCYPAQGFQVLNNETGTLATDYGEIRVRRLLTRLGEQRMEPVTYWTTLGHHVVRGGMETKMMQLRYGFSGEIADGMLFRVSSIDGDTQRAYEEQKEFVRQLLASVEPEIRQRLAPTNESAR